MDAVGAVEAAFLKKLYEAMNALKWQMIANTEQFIENEVRSALGDILSESFNELVVLITNANSAGGYAFSGSSDLEDGERKIGGSGFIFDNYQYPELTKSWVGKKRKMGYSGSAVFKGERFKKSKSSSLVGVMAALAKNKELANQLLQAFGDYRNSSIGSYHQDYLSEYFKSSSDDYLIFKKNAEKKRAELLRKKRPIA